VRDATAIFVQTRCANTIVLIKNRTI